MDRSPASPRAIGSRDDAGFFRQQPTAKERSRVTPEKILQLCTNIGLTDELDPTKPKPKSLRFAMGRNARHIGYAYISPDDPNPQGAALRLGKQYDCNEAWHGSPCDHAPMSYITTGFYD